MIQKYLGDSKMFEYDKYYHTCQQENKPFIKARINPAHNNYFVQLDLITCNYILTVSEQIEIKKLIQNLNNGANTLKFNIDPQVVWFDGILSEDVDTFCNALYDLTQRDH